MFQDKPWLQSYEPHVPEHIDYPEMTLHEALEETAGSWEGGSRHGHPFLHLISAKQQRIGSPTLCVLDRLSCCL